MTAFPWNPGDDVVIWGVNVLLQVTLVTAIALLIACFIRQNPVARYWVLCSTLFLVLLSPVAAALIQSTGLSVFSVSLLDPDLPDETIHEPAVEPVQPTLAASTGEAGVPPIEQPFLVIDPAKDIPFGPDTPAAGLNGALGGTIGRTPGTDSVLILILVSASAGSFSDSAAATRASTSS